jgi:N-acetylglucosamine-6-phosphate deacetylase
MKTAGLIDLQINGYQGVDFSDLHLTEEAFIRACRGILDSETTAFLATLVTSPVEVYERNLPLIAAVMQRREFEGRLLGIHMEGPFISPEEGARGAHLLKWIKRPDLDLLKNMCCWSDNRIKLLTLAAELEEAESLCRYAVQKGICVSLGHQMASEEDIVRLVEAGACCLTHLGNGVPSMINRHDNPIWTGLADDRLAAMIITDGHHITPAMIKTIIRTKGYDKVIMVSDQTAVTGLKAGRHKLFDDDVILTAEGRLYNPQTGYLAGSGCTLLQCCEYLISLDLISEAELVQMVYDNPLKLLNLQPEDLQVS